MEPQQLWIPPRIHLPRDFSPSFLIIHFLAQLAGDFHIKHIIAFLKTTELFLLFLHQAAEEPGCRALAAQLQTQGSSFPGSKTLLISEARYIFVFCEVEIFQQRI